MENIDKAIAIISLAIFYIVAVSNIPGIYKAIGIGTLMYLVGEYLRKKYDLEGEYGFMMIKTTKGIQDIVKAAKRFQPWLKVWVDIFIGVAFGAVGIAFMRWRTLKEKIIIFFISSILIFILSILSPVAISFVFQVTHSIGESSVASMPKWVVVIPYIFGMGGSITLSLYTSAAKTLVDLINVILNNGPMPTKAGATLLLPGINLPLIEGLLALGILLVVHEGSHALLSVVGRIKLISSGIALFGVIPVGGFIEPDEERLNKASVMAQSRVYVAGSAANLTFAIIVFLLFISFSVLTSQYAINGCLVVGGDVIKPGTIIYSINGNSTCNISKEINEIKLNTSSGEITLHRKENGKFGFYIIKLDREALVPRVYSTKWAQFIYNFLGLLFALNIVVGIINLLPIPLFDGQHLTYALFGKNAISKAIVYTALVSLIIVLIPGIL